MKCFHHRLDFQVIGLEQPDDHDPFSRDEDADDREDEDEPDEPGEVMMASPAALQVVDKSPTEVILDLGCTKAMGSRAAVNHFCKYIDSEGQETYQIKPTYLSSPLPIAKPPGALRSWWFT